MEENDNIQQPHATTKVCPNCGQEIAASAKKCRHCGEWLEKQCPYCGEWINAKAEKCKHCGNWLSEIARRKYENRMGITRDKEKAQNAQKPLSDSDKIALKLVGCAGCLMHVENIFLAICLIIGCGFNVVLSIALCIGFSVLMMFSTMRGIYIWVMTLMWGSVGYGIGGWLGAIFIGILAWAFHAFTISGMEAKEKLKN